MKDEKKNKKSKESLSSKILRYTDFSSGLKNGLNFSLISNGKTRTILVGGVKRIKKYTPDNVTLVSCHEDVIFSGEKMACVTYASGAIEISGEINEIKFCMEKDKK